MKESFGRTILLASVTYGVMLSGIQTWVKTDLFQRPHKLGTLNFLITQ